VKPQPQAQLIDAQGPRKCESVSKYGVAKPVKRTRDDDDDNDDDKKKKKLKYFQMFSNLVVQINRNKLHKF